MLNRHYARRLEQATPKKEIWHVRLMAPQWEAPLFHRIELLLRQSQWCVALRQMPARPRPHVQRLEAEALQLRCLPRGPRRSSRPIRVPSETRNIIIRSP